jgi:hypothetical protein
MLLGTAHIEGKADHDKIKCADTGTFREIQLRVTGSAVQFDRVVVAMAMDSQKKLLYATRLPHAENPAR